jgi:RimJ/RimL family protein N-acetyltransferase
MIFSDTIYTAVVIEGHGRPYTIVMKLLDLLSFIILSFAVVVLNPSATNMFQVNATEWIQHHCDRLHCSRETLFWLLLTLYVGVLIRWNYLMRTYIALRRHTWVRWGQWCLGGVFLLMALLTLIVPTWEWILVGARWFILGLTIVYLRLYKPFLTALLDKSIQLRPLWPSDVTAINAWPPYPSQFEKLDYALRANGWLDQFPRSAKPPAKTLRFAAWREGQLVGFAILTDITDTAAEFYLAIHPDHLRLRLGGEITQQVLSFGFREVGLRRIYLKVRTWHPAFALYERLGFKKIGAPFVETIPGQAADEFIMMECKV